MASSKGRLEEPFVLNGMLSLVAATLYLFLRRDYLLEYFYFNELLAATHLVTLGFLTSVMMGVLHRLAPMFFQVEPDSRLVSRVQFGTYALGTWGMISHFFLGELTGMSWSTFLVWLASLLQIWNFRGIFTTRSKHRWSARFVSASLVYFFLAASVGVLLGLVKGYGVRAVFFSDDYLDNVFAHAHLAAVGWVVMMIVGFQLQLVPATVGHAKSLPNPLRAPQPRYARTDLAALRRGTRRAVRGVDRARLSLADGRAASLGAVGRGPGVGAVAARRVRPDGRRGARACAGLAGSRGGRSGHASSSPTASPVSTGSWC